MDQAERTRTAVHALLQRVGGGDPAKIAALYADAVTWTLAWPEDEYDGMVPWIRHRSTRADVEDHYRTLSEHHVHGETTADISAILVDGADAAVVGELGQTLRATNANYRTGFVLYLTVTDDGLISRHHIVEDNLAVKRAFQSTVQPAA